MELAAFCTAGAQKYPNFWRLPIASKARPESPAQHIATESAMCRVFETRPSLGYFGVTRNGAGIGVSSIHSAVGTDFHIVNWPTALCGSGAALAVERDAERLAPMPPIRAELSHGNIAPL
jgi:hypothetical protein